MAFVQMSHGAFKYIFKPRSVNDSQFFFKTGKEKQTYPNVIMSML